MIKDYLWNEDLQKISQMNCVIVCVMIFSGLTKFYIIDILNGFSIHGILTFRWPLIRFSMIHAQFSHNQWNSYDRKGKPQMFISSYITEIDEIFSNSMEVADANLTNITRHAFFHEQIIKVLKQSVRMGLDLNVVKTILILDANLAFT